jgi:hypothetical protein
VAAYRSSLRVVTDPSLVPDGDGTGGYAEAVLRLAYTDSVVAPALSPVSPPPAPSRAAPLIPRPDPQVAGTRGRRARALGDDVMPPGRS